jgi:hypothetical protein
MPDSPALPVEPMAARARFADNLGRRRGGRIELQGGHRLSARKCQVRRFVKLRELFQECHRRPNFIVTPVSGPRWHARELQPVLDDVEKLRR